MIGFGIGEFTAPVKRVAPRGLTCLAAALLLASCQTTSGFETQADEGLMWLKPDQTGEEHASDVAACSTRAQNTRVRNSSTYISGSGGLIGLMASAITAGIMQGIERAEARSAIFESCMENGGYTPIPVSLDLVTDYREAEEDEVRANLIDSFMTSPEYEPIQAYFTALEKQDAETYQAYLASHPGTVLADDIELRYEAILIAQERRAALETQGFLELVAHSFRGLSPEGWRYDENALEGVDCTIYSRTTGRILLRNGVAQGSLTVDETTTVPVFGTLGENDSLSLVTQWPEEDPIVFALDLSNESDSFSGPAESRDGQFCTQFALFAVKDDEELAAAGADSWLGSAPRPNYEIMAELNK